MFPLIPLPYRYPKSHIHLPSTLAAAQHCLGTPYLEGQTKAKPLHCCCISNGLPRFPRYSLRHKELLCEPPGTHGRHWQPERDAQRDAPHTSRFCPRGRHGEVATFKCGLSEWHLPAQPGLLRMLWPRCSSPLSHLQGSADTSSSGISRPHGCSAGRSLQQAGTHGHGSARLGSHLPAQALPRLAAPPLCH